MKFVTLSEVEMLSRILEMAFDSAQADKKTFYETASSQLSTVTFAERSRGEPNKIWLLVRKRTFIIYFFIALISSIVQEAFSFLSLPSCIFFT